jgi:hypothetical protein
MRSINDTVFGPLRSFMLYAADSYTRPEERDRKLTPIYWFKYIYVAPAMKRLSL